LSEVGPDRPAGFWQWMRHNWASIAAAAVDYLVMILFVEVGGLGPVAATPIGAFAGGITNFTLGRRFTYKTTEVPAPRQAWRYALVSAGSLGLNTAGEYLFHRVLRLNYVLARVISSVIVSNAWNFPLQRYFVFSAAQIENAERSAPTSAPPTSAPPRQPPH
jgi:putative flippase GtrA